jgi:hypothetical protein
MESISRRGKKTKDKGGRTGQGVREYMCGLKLSNLFKIQCVWMSTCLQTDKRDEVEFAQQTRQAKNDDDIPRSKVCPYHPHHSN